MKFFPAFRYLLLFTFVTAASAGCAKLRYMESALTLKGYADEQEAQHRDVSRQDQLTERLFELVRSGAAGDRIGTAAQLEAAYGKPVLKRRASGAASGEEWLYRYQVKYLASPKVYVWVDPAGNVKSFRYEEGPGIPE